MIKAGLAQSHRHSGNVKHHGHYGTSFNNLWPSTLLTCDFQRRQTQARLLEEKKQRGFASARKVFDIAELLEKILLNVDDMRTVLLAQRVDRTFKATIDGSVLLKKKLWLLPDTTEEKLEINPIWKWSRWRVEPLRTLPFFETWICGSAITVEARIQSLFTLGGSWKDMIVARQQNSGAAFTVDFVVSLGPLGGYFDPERLQDKGGNLMAMDVMDRMKQLVREEYPEKFDKEGLLLPPGESKY